jgi:hypothetical protein
VIARSMAHSQWGHSELLGQGTGLEPEGVRSLLRREDIPTTSDVYGDSKDGS